MTKIPAVLAVVAVALANAVNPNSIRQVVRTMLLAGADTKAITVVLKDRFPTSAAAAKSVVHIAYYRSELRKQGLLPAYIKA